MRNTTFYSPIKSQTKQTQTENQDWTSYNTSILLSMGGGFLCGLLGLLSFVVFTLSGGNTPAYNYAGIGFMFLAATMLGVGAHFMDKADENERGHKKSRIHRFKENNFIN